MKRGRVTDSLLGHAGDALLDRGSGNDTLTGGAGSDTYVFARGSGQDTILNTDAGTGKVDVIRFGDGISSTDVRATRNGNDLVLALAGGTDRITVQGYFLGDAAGSSRLEEVRFADGSVWDIATVKTLVTRGTASADVLQGYATADTLEGLDGNDTLWGHGGTDVLFGGAGADALNGGADADRLEGGAGADSLNGDAGADLLRGGADADSLTGGDGNDTLEGGAGSDTLVGGSGNDTYVFARGDGQDTVVNTDSTAGRSDGLRFAAGIAIGDVRATRSGNDLLLALAGGSDRVTVRGYFIDDAAGTSRLDAIRFADGSSWDVATVKALVLRGTSDADTLRGFATADTIDGLDGNDAIYGEAGADALRGGAGADTLSGGAGNDTLDGGAGSDVLDGGLGSDTYRFGRGGGQDSLTDTDTTAGHADVLSFGSGIAAEQLWFRRSGTALEVSVIGTTDRVTVNGWHAGSSQHVEQFRTADGHVLLDTQVASLVDAMAAFAPPAIGQTQLPADVLARLQPVIAANWQAG